MRGADGIDTHRLQLCQFAVHGILVDDGTQAAEIVVLADTVQFHIPAIEPEASRSVKPKVTEGGSRPHLIDDLTSRQHLRAYLICIRGIGRPQMRMPHLHAHLLAVSVKDGIPNLIVVSFHIHINLHLSCRGIGLYVDTPVPHVDGIRPRQPHMTVDATTRIPSGVRLVTVVHPDGNDIIARLQVFRNIILEGTVAVRTEAHLLSVDIDGSVHIDTVKLYKSLLIRDILNREPLPVPADTAGQGSPTRSTGIASMEVPLYRPVMGQVEGTPLAVIIGW